MDLLFLEDGSSNCQTLILWFRREIIRNRSDLTQKAKSIFPLALVPLKILSRCLIHGREKEVPKWEGREGSEYFVEEIMLFFSSHRNFITENNLLKQLYNYNNMSFYISFHSYQSREGNSLNFD